MSNKWKPSQDAWNRFLDEAINRAVIKAENEDYRNQFKYDFSKLCKCYGDAYLAYVQASYIAKDSMSDEDFCRVNGNIPMSFLKKL